MPRGRVKGVPAMCIRKYNRALLVPKICALLATGQEPLTVVCRGLNIPYGTVRKWRDDKAVNDRFDDAFAQGCDVIAAECLGIADDGRRDYAVSEDGIQAVNQDHIQRSKLRIDTRLKLLAKWDPRRYGEKMTLAGDKDNPVFAERAVDISQAQLLAIAATALPKAKAK